MDKREVHVFAKKVKNFLDEVKLPNAAAVSILRDLALDYGATEESACVDNICSVNPKATLLVFGFGNIAVRAVHWIQSGWEVTIYAD